MIKQWTRISQGASCFINVPRPRWIPMFTLGPSTFKPNKRLLKLLILKLAKAVLMVSFIPSASALEIDPMPKYLLECLHSKKEQICSCSMTPLSVLPSFNTEKKFAFAKSFCKLSRVTLPIWSVKFVVARSLR